MTKLQKIAFAVSAGIAAATSAISAFAATLSPVALPSSTAPDALAFVGGQIADPGTYLLILLVVGVPFAFYLVKKIRGVVPK
jgi:hypothetical protein